ncbi:nucleoporin 62 like isoform X2 [Silurus meridionalis]|uniref:nucleoporin 62 like isoform X2 n=1 Tax=Silurus meridionalis TaxID=175797 RepID=UPI001EEB2416|nr:nucleoporin 62 like isoform X2 [Silurus meridionalis]
MSFSFGQPSGGGGFSFGTPKTTATTGAVPGFSLPTNAPPSGGFSFGAVPQQQPQAPATTSQIAGLLAQTTTSTGAPQGGFSFGAAAQSSTPGGGFSFGGAPKLSLGLTPASQPASTAATLGGLLNSSNSSSGTGFTFGGLATQTAASTQQPTGGFSFPGAKVQAPAATTAQSTPSFSLGGQSTGLTLGSAVATLASSTGINFGIKPAATPTPASTAAASAQALQVAQASQALQVAQASQALQVAQASQALQVAQASQALQVAQASQAAQAAQASQALQAAQAAQASQALQAAQAAQALQAAQASQAFQATQASQAVQASQAAPVSSLFAIAVPPTSAPSFSLGGLISTAAPAASSATASTGLMLKPLGAANTTGTTAAAVSSAATTSFSLGLKPAVSAAPPISTVVSTAAVIASAAPVMSYAQLESLINKWSSELEDQERHFLQQATQVNAWDRMLVENGEKITSLHKDMEKVKLDQRRLDQELDFILSQQKELEDLLIPLEESVKEQSGTIYMQNADEERERTYKLAENVDAQLKRMSQDLKEIIEHLNTSNGLADTSDPAVDPFKHRVIASRLSFIMDNAEPQTKHQGKTSLGFALQQICKILNAHMDSLQWVEQNSVLLQRRVEEVSKLCESRSKEQEKSFRLSFQ